MEMPDKIKLNKMPTSSPNSCNFSYKERRKEGGEKERREGGRNKPQLETTGAVTYLTANIASV